jgi:hypothetical protein
MQPLVIDIYHGDNVSSFTQVKDAGIVGVIHKASQGGAGRRRTLPTHSAASSRWVLA